MSKTGTKKEKGKSRRREKPNRLACFENGLIQKQQKKRIGKREVKRKSPVLIVFLIVFDVHFFIFFCLSIAMWFFFHIFLSFHRYVVFFFNSFIFEHSTFFSFLIERTTSEPNSKIVSAKQSMKHSTKMELSRVLGTVSCCPELQNQFWFAVVFCCVQTFFLFA